MILSPRVGGRRWLRARYSTIIALRRRGWGSFGALWASTQRSGVIALPKTDRSSAWRSQGRARCAICRGLALPNISESRNSLPFGVRCTGLVVSRGPCVSLLRVL
eukprot:1484842-Amphidinium_carterae.4